MYIQHNFIQPDAVEFREYQINIASSAEKQNTLVVLPTGLGKTIIALFLIAKKLKNKDKKILFLAPTKPLVTQHAKTLTEFLTISEDHISIFTGEVSPEKRKKQWDESRIIVSTPQVIENDLLSHRISLTDVSFIIFDEAHHAMGKYAYVFIAEMYQKQSISHHILGITASPGREMDKILDVCANLFIENVEIRTKYDADVKPYVHDLHIAWKQVAVPDDFSYAVNLFKKALKKRLRFLHDLQLIESSSISKISKKKLIDVQKKIQMEIRSRSNPPKTLYQAASMQSETLKLLYGKELLETQGVESVKRYFNRIRKDAGSKSGSKSAKNLMTDTSVIEVLAYLNTMNSEHPKLQTVKDIVRNQIKVSPASRIIIFTHFRDTAAMVTDMLSSVNKVKPVRFVGQSGKADDKGLTQKQQTQIVQDFKKGQYNVLIATSVAEEGLDIPSTDLVVFYEPIPSEIRNIQRRGRTARKMPGSIIILITKGTADEGYYWASKRKEKRMKNELEVLRSNLKKNINDRQDIYDKNVKFISNQKTLKEFQMKDKSIKIIADHREYRSSVVRNLTIKDVLVEPKQLDVGDYVISSRIGVERKNVDDFLESLITGKLFKQTSRLREAYSRPIIIIEGDDLLNRRNISHKAIFGSIVSIIVDFGIPVITTKNAIDTADLLLVMANREQRDGKKDIALRGEKTSMSNRERQQFVIEGFPNVSAVIAKRLLDHFTSIKDIVNASEEELQDVSGVGKNIASDIYHLLNSKYLEE